MTNPKFGLLEELEDFAVRHPQARSAFLCRDAKAEIERLRSELAAMTAERDVWVKGFVREAYPTPVHPDPTGQTREASHCPTCECVHWTEAPSAAGRAFAAPAPGESVKSSGLMSVWRCKPCGTEHAENVNECSLCGSSNIVPLQVSRTADEA